MYMLSIYSFVSGYIIRILSFCGWLILITPVCHYSLFEKCKRLICLAHIKVV